MSFLYRTSHGKDHAAMTRRITPITAASGGDNDTRTD
jgi:hypothetical protein